MGKPVKELAVKLTFFVSNIDLAIDFYVAKLKRFDVIWDDLNNGRLPDDPNRCVVLFYKNERTYFGLKIWRASAENAHMVGRQAGDSVLLELPIDDVDIEWANCKKEGIEVSEIDEVPYMGWFIVTDPFGNKLVLSQYYCTDQIISDA